MTEQTIDQGSPSLQSEHWRSRLDEMQARVATIPQCVAIGYQVTRMEPDWCWGKIDWREELVGDAESGVIAGGVITTLLDSMCGGAVQSALPEPHPSVTLDLRIDYMRPAEPHREIRCEAHCYKVTRSICFVRGTAYHDDPSDPIATAAASFILTGAERVPTRTDGVAAASFVATKEQSQ